MARWCGRCCDPALRENVRVAANAGEMVQCGRPAAGATFRLGRPSALFRPSARPIFEEVLTLPLFWASLTIVLVAASLATSRGVNKTKSACPSAAIAPRSFQRRAPAIYGGTLVCSHRVAASIVFVPQGIFRTCRISPSSTNVELAESIRRFFGYRLPPRNDREITLMVN